MDKYSFKEFIKSLSWLALLFMGFISGALTSAVSLDTSKHTEKHGCEYVEKSKCKQVWIKVGG